MRLLFCLGICSIALLFSCSSPAPKILTEAERLQLRVDSVKTLARDGDLITRLNDNMVSIQVRLLSLTDKSFSHSGIIQTINGVKMVTHIDSDAKGADTVRFEPIDSFINPAKNLSGGLYRYDLSDEERKAFVYEMNEYHRNNVRFDRAFALGTDSVVYCSEMIAKAMKKATNDRVIIASTIAPKGMVKLVHSYIEGTLTEKELETTPFIAIDNLYLNPHCKEIMRFTLKQFPGQ